MNTFFRICIFICLSLIVFNLVFAVINGLGAFPHEGEVPGQEFDESNALSRLTGLSDPNMNAIWAGVVGLSFLGVVVLAAVTHSVIPIGMHLFSTVFWTSWIHTQSILSYGGLLPDDIVSIFFVGVLFVFIAAIVGILTGSG